MILRYPDDLPQLKKVINQLVHELEALGLDAATIQSLQSDQIIRAASALPLNEGSVPETSVQAAFIAANTPRLVYEIVSRGRSAVEPRLRIWLPDPTTSTVNEFDTKDLPLSNATSILWTLNKHSQAPNEAVAEELEQRYDDHNAPQ
jgi:hypothetical protein